MKKILKHSFYVFFILLLFIQCAKRGTPTGGPEDELPPTFIRATPNNYSTNFNAEEIRIYFDEYVKLENSQKQIIISPPMDPAPTITPLGTASKYIRIQINDTLAENTTYVINFGRSIVDNNAANPLPFFKYIFSAGSAIDSLSVSGEIKDAFERIPDSYVSVMLYEVDSTYTDSIIYNEVPRYITNTLDSATTFQLTNLKAGTYQLIALKDKNNNYKYEPTIDKIGYASEPIEIPTENIFSLELYPETPEFEITKPAHLAAQHLIFGYKGEIDLKRIEILQTPVQKNFEYRIFQDQKTDTLHYFYKPKITADSLNFEIIHHNYAEEVSVKLKELEKDSLLLDILPKNEIGFNDSLIISGNIPLEIQDEKLFNLYDKDSLPVAFTAEMLEYQNKIFIDFEKSENQVYRFEALPGAITDFFGSKNDSISHGLKTKEYSDYGNLFFSVQNLPKHQVILQLVNSKKEVVMQKIGKTLNSFEFLNIKPAKYFLRIIFDTNENGQWDAGNFLKKIQPEKVIYFPNELDIRANWDVSETFILE
ncbi:MAG TPA: Ig-like domain-containing protein [Salinimicrobium sp.]|nr:Ig-like domain-containing protein [Salinimicrobium sp.]